MALVQTREHLLGGLELEHERLIALRFLFKARQRLIDRGDVGQHELGLNGFDVALRVDLLGNVLDIGVAEETNDLANRIGLANVGQELIAQALALACAGNQASNVNEFDRCRHDFSRMVDFREFIQTIIGNGNHARIGLNGGKRIVRSEPGFLGKGGEKRRLANVGQANNTDRKRHAHPLHTYLRR